MGRFTLVENALWDDPSFLALSASSRLLFIWSWTNPRASICGLYHASERQMQRAIGDADLMATLRELSEKPLLLYDHPNEVVWVINRVRYANRSPKVAAAMQREVTEVPPTPLMRPFLQMYGTRLGLKEHKENKHGNCQHDCREVGLDRRLYAGA